MENPKILSILGCGAYIVLDSDTGIWLARHNLEKVGFLSREWHNAIAKLIDVDTLEQHLTKCVDDDDLENYYDEVDTMEGLNGNECYKFISDADAGDDEDEAMIDTNC